MSKKYMMELDEDPMIKLTHMAVDLKIPRQKLINQILTDYVNKNNFTQTDVRKKRKLVKK